MYLKTPTEFFFSFLLHIIKSKTKSSSVNGNLRLPFFIRSNEIGNCTPYYVIVSLINIDLNIVQKSSVSCVRTCSVVLSELLHHSIIIMVVLKIHLPKAPGILQGYLLDYVVRCVKTFQKKKKGLSKYRLTFITYEIKEVPWLDM